MAEQIDPTPGNTGFRNVGPRSIQGVEASDLPDKGRGSVDEEPGKVLKRKPPDCTGGTPQETGGDVGMRTTPDAADAADHRGHGKNAGL